MEPSFKAKVVLAGESGVGKTSIFNKLRGVDVTMLWPTIKPQTNSIVVDTDMGSVEIDLWDTAGQEQYVALTPAYFHCATVAILVFDLTAHFTFESIPGFYDMIWNSSDIPVLFIIGNKQDLPGHAVTAEELDSLARDLKGTCALVSAETGFGIDALKQDVAKAIAGIQKCKTSEPVSVVVGEPLPGKQQCVPCAAGGL